MAKSRPRAPQKHIPGGAPLVRRDRIKVPVYFEQQKTQARDTIRQLALTELDLEGDELEAQVELSSLDLSPEGNQVSFGIYNMLNDRGFDKSGHFLGDGRERIPPQDRLVGGENKRTWLELDSWSELYRACWLEKNADGRYPGKKREAVRAGMNNLARARTLFCSIKTGTHPSGDPRYTTVQHHGPLAYYTEVDGDLTAEEVAMVKAGEGHKLSKKTRAGKARRKKIIIHISPFMALRIATFHAWIPGDFYPRLEEAKRSLGMGRRHLKDAALFVGWLYTLGIPKVKKTDEELAEMLGFESLTTKGRRRRTDLRQKIRDCAEIAKADQIGILKGYSEPGEEAVGQWVFHINHEESSRLKRALQQKEQKPLQEGKRGKGAKDRRGPAKGRGR